MTATKGKATSWDRVATEAWEAHQELEAGRHELQQQTDVDRATDWWRTLGLGKLEPHAVRRHQDGTLVELPGLQDELQVAVLVPARGRAFLLLVKDGHRWQPAGELGTAADLGRVLVDGLEAFAPAQEQLGLGEQLALLFQALVSDAVDAKLEGQL